MGRIDAWLFIRSFSADVDMLEESSQPIVLVCTAAISPACSSVQWSTACLATLAW
jgi:hypothetical protein